MIKTIYVFIITVISHSGLSQSIFEGEINYTFELQKKDSSFDETSVLTYPAKTSRLIFKNGNWIAKLDEGIIEYSYFNHRENRIYWKIRGSDTLIYESGLKRRENETDSMLSTNLTYNTDTILGYICNRLIIETTDLKLTFIYSPAIQTNPEWYMETKIGYYDIIYGVSKSFYLKSIVETEQFVSKMTAQEVVKRSVRPNEFPEVENNPLRKL